LFTTLIQNTKWVCMGIKYVKEGFAAWLTTAMMPLQLTN